jgi:FolB domain-containing protein
VRVENLLLNVRLADGVRWPSVLPILQPVNLTVVIPHNCEPSARNDDLSASINYGILSKSIIRLCEQCVVASKTFASVENLADSVASICFSTFPSIREIRLSFRKPKALLHAEAVTFDTAYLDGQIIFPECYGVQGLVYHTIIGVNDAERIHQQIVRSNLSIKRSARTEAAFDYSSLANAIGKVNHIFARLS